jgi:hypothetical protein
MPKGIGIAKAWTRTDLHTFTLCYLILIIRAEKPAPKSRLKTVRLYTTKVSATSYADLEIRILDKQDRGYPVEITFTGDQQFPRGFLDPNAQPQIDRVRPQETGNQLFSWLFSDDILKTAWARARGEQTFRRIRLRIDATAPELHTIPWELLRDPGSADIPQDITAAEATPFSRYLAGQWVPGSPILKRPIRMLVAIASPSDLSEQGLPALDGDTEWNCLRNELKSNPNIELIRLPDPCTLAALDSTLRKGIHILHFIGHGAWLPAKREAVLYMSDQNNLLVPVKDAAIAGMLARQFSETGSAHDDPLRLVYLSSCQTAVRDSGDAFRGLAPRLVASGVPAVMAMQDLVPVKTAIEFSRVFYSSLLGHGQIDRAANAARSFLLTSGIRGAGIPVLFMRVRSGELFGKSVTHAGHVSTTGHDSSSLDKTSLDKIAQILVARLGPIALTLVETTGRRETSLEAVCRTVGQEIESPTDRKAFLQSCSTLLGIAISAAVETEPPASPMPETKAEPASWDPAVLGRVQAELAAYVGPMASVLVDRATGQAGSADRLYEILSLEIPTAADRRKFLAAVRTRGKI